jgi:hypothetical protein
MGSWMAVIAECPAGFWTAAEKLGVKREPGMHAEAPHALIDCAWDYEGTHNLARSLSRATAAKTIALVIQTTSDVHEVVAYERGEQLRRLSYSRDSGGWIAIEGTPQPWEPTYLFGMFDEEADEALLAAARAKNDPLSVREHLRPSSTVHGLALCESFGLKGDKPDARWKKPSLLSRLFG